MVKAAGISLSLLLLVTCAQADTYRIDLPELSGSYTYFTGLYRSFNVDVGTAFLSIESVNLEITGTSTPGYNFEGMPRLSQFLARLPESSVRGPTYDTYTEFSDTLSFSSWDSLLDGQVQGSLEYERMNYIDGGFGEGYPSGSINTATLVIEGTPVPEPVTLSVLAMGGLAFIRRRKA